MKSTITFLLLMGSLLILSSLQQQQGKSANEQLIDYYQSQRFAEAVTFLKTTYPEPVADPKILSSMAYASQMAGKLSDAEGYYQRIYSVDTGNFHILFNLSNINMLRGNELKAKGYFIKLLEKDSTNFNVYRNMAQISLNDNDVDQTVSYLEKANHLRPENADIASELSDFYTQLKRFDRAEDVLDAAIEADHENVYLVQSLVKLEFAQQKWKEVIENGEELFRLGYRSAYVLNKVGQAYYYNKNFICAIETLAEIQPNYQTEGSYYFIAESYKALNDQPRAIEYFNKAIAAGLSPNIDSYYSEIADSFTGLRKDKKALAAYQKALQFDGKPFTYYLMASLYDTGLKDNKAALKYYKKYIASNPPEKEYKYITYAKTRIEVLNR